MQQNIKKLYFKHIYKVAIIIAIIVITTSIWLSWQQLSNTLLASCQQLVVESDNLIKKGEYKQAYFLLTRYPQKKCQNPSPLGSTTRDKVQAKISGINFSYNSAVSAFESGDKTQAQIYAQDALQANAKLTAGELAQLSDDDNKMINLLSIQDGSYRNNSGIEK